MKEKSSALKLNTKTHSIYCLVAFILAIGALGFFIAAVISSAFFNLGSDAEMIRVGMLEIISMVMTLSGLVFGIVGEFMTNDIRVLSHIALPIHTLLLIAHIIVLVGGY